MLIEGICMCMHMQMYACAHAWGKRMPTVGLRAHWFSMMSWPPRPSDPFIAVSSMLGLETCATMLAILGLRLAKQALSTLSHFPILFSIQHNTVFSSVSKLFVTHSCHEGEISFLLKWPWVPQPVPRSCACLGVANTEQNPCFIVAVLVYLCSLLPFMREKEYELGWVWRNWKKLV